MAANLKTTLSLDNEQFQRNLSTSTKQIREFNDRVNKLGSTLKSITVGFIGFAGISSSLNSIIQTSKGFEKSLSTLQSLTGQTTKEMEFFRQEAIRLGSTTTQTSSQVAEAFQLIGSQAPELLKNKTALSQVTEEAIILSEAAQITVPEAAKALVGALNQMGASMNEGTEYINILAAASQNGAAAIPYLNTAIEKAGGTASSVGVKFHELVAAIEAIAPKITEASIAGNNLRNIFLILEASTDKNLKPSIVGFTNALENLAAKQLDVTELTKMFGRESVTAALALINSKEEYVRLTSAITGTNTALEQQKINNDNLTGAIYNLQSAWEGFTLTMNKSNGILKESANWLAKMISNFTELVKSNDAKFIEQVTRETKLSNKEIDKQINRYEKLGITGKDALSLIKKSYEESLPNTSTAVANAERDLENLNKRLKSFGPKNEFDKFLDFAEPSSHLSFGDRRSKIQLEKEIELQKALVRDLRAKEEVIKNSLNYLDDTLNRVENIKNVVENTNPGSSTSGVSKEVMELTLADQYGKNWVKNEIENMFSNNPVTVPLPIKPLPYIDSDEVPDWDITGSIIETQKKISDITLLYNYATTDELRAIYKKQKEDLERHLEEMTNTTEALVNISDLATGLVSSSFTNAFESIGDALGSFDSAESMRKMLINLMDMLKQFGTALVAAGIAKMAFDKLLINGPGAIIAGGALIVTASAAKAALNKAATSFASGGIVYGETFARVGEYPGAANNPEVIAPLDKLRNLIQPQGNGMGEGTVKFEISGDKLYGVLQNYQYKQGRIR